ncbi:hypothetical protein [Lysinibacillus sp. NPDC093216]|uniref:hypothetical protein n=1 Tax=Lysinibacillus sp. NPDC093216 TaxID=3390576 RepID=UPI003D0112B4
MHTVQQLQAADYFLKIVLEEKNDYKELRNLKFIIELNNSLWYGDFVNFKEDYVFQYELDIQNPRPMTYEIGNSTFISKIWAKYNANPFISNLLLKHKCLELLYSEIFEIVKKADIQPTDSKIYPYLLNAKSLDGKLELPFINIGDEKVKVISLIEVPKLKITTTSFALNDNLDLSE